MIGLVNGRVGPIQGDVQVLDVVDWSAAGHTTLL